MHDEGRLRVGYQICIAKCLHSLRDHLPENLGNTTDQKMQNFHFQLMYVAQNRL